MKNNVALQIIAGLLILAGLSVSRHTELSRTQKRSCSGRGAPGAKGNNTNDKPTMTIYLPAKEKAAGSAVVIFPGGGYNLSQSTTRVTMSPAG